MSLWHPKWWNPGWWPWWMIVLVLVVQVGFWTMVIRGRR